MNARQRRIVREGAASAIQEAQALYEMANYPTLLNTAAQDTLMDMREQAKQLSSRAHAALDATVIAELQERRMTGVWLTPMLRLTKEDANVE